MHVDAILWYGIQYVPIGALMKRKAKQKEKQYKKITLNVPVDLLEEALQAGGDNLTETVRKGLQLIAAKNAFQGIRKLRGKVNFSLSADELRYDG
jgi:hypothetical protein